MYGWVILTGCIVGIVIYSIITIDAAIKSIQIPDEVYQAISIMAEIKNFLAGRL